MSVQTLIFASAMAFFASCFLPGFEQESVDQNSPDHLTNEV
jgi:hypothetical protein